jgi:uncharacterized protein YkwD
MRPFLVLMLIAVAGSAQAQYPWGYAPGYHPPPAYQPPSYQPPAYPPPAGAPASLAREMLNAHNTVRARVGVPPLTWSAQLAAVAQQWANHLIASGGFSHRPDNRYGENLYAISGAAASPAQAVGAWAGEARGYDYRSNTCYGMCGHYTQIVWRGTTSVGCAVATDPEREVWVCNYNPPGNVVGYRPY